MNPIDVLQEKLVARQGDLAQMQQAQTRAQALADAYTPQIDAIVTDMVDLQVAIATLQGAPEMSAIAASSVVRKFT